jgi:uncharacterized protein (DUF1684 family)
VEDEMKREELENWLISKGYSKDKFGHYQKTIGETDVRYKMQADSVRYEKRITFAATDYSPKQNEWLRLASGYYKSLSITPEGKLAGMKR